MTAALGGILSRPRVLISVAAETPAYAGMVNTTSTRLATAFRDESLICTRARLLLAKSRLLHRLSRHNTRCVDLWWYRRDSAPLRSWFPAQFPDRQRPDDRVLPTTPRP